jgi:hypothetical protein
MELNPTSLAPRNQVGPAGNVAADSLFHTFPIAVFGRLRKVKIRFIDARKEQEVALLLLP